MSKDDKYTDAIIMTQKLTVRSLGIEGSANTISLYEIEQLKAENERLRAILHNVALTIGADDSPTFRTHIANQMKPLPEPPPPIEGMLRSVAAHEYTTDGVTPIAIEKMEGGKWTRLGYDGGSRIITIEEWKAGPFGRC